MTDTRQVLENAILDLQNTKESLHSICNFDTDRLVINASHKAIDRIEQAISELNELF